MPRSRTLRRFPRRRTGRPQSSSSVPPTPAPTRRRRTYLLCSAIAAAILVFFVLLWPFAKDHLEAISVLQQVSLKPVPRPIEDLVSHPVTVRDLTLDTESGPIRGRLYLPPHPERAPALVIFHGVHYLGIDYGHLEDFARAMASCGLRVLTPELPDIKDYHVDDSSITTIGESVHWFAQQTGGPVGVMGLSFSGGLSLVAAADPLYKRDFKFVLAVGSQDSMGRVATYYRTGADARPNGSTELLPAHEYGPLVLEYEYVEDFVPPPDVRGIRAALRAHLYEDKSAEAVAKSRLTDWQKAEFNELLDPESQWTRGLIQQAIHKHADELDDLSPRAHLKTMTVPVYLLHGQADNIIPSAETLWMASELPSVTLQAMLVSPVISHVDFGGGKPSLWDQWRLIHFFALVMHASETPTGRTPGL